MNQKGITMATVVVMIIIMLIIATVSIVAGNKIIVNSKEYEEIQEVESVKAAVLRKKTEVNMAGTLVPIGESYVGIVDPIIKNDSTDTVVAKNWYLLDEESLEKLGIHDASSRYLVNYDYEVVLSTASPDYFEEYMVSEFLHELIDSQNIAGTPLENKKTSGDGLPMVKNKKENEVFGTGWYLLKKADFSEEYKEDIKHSYLIHLDRAEYVKVTSDFEGIDIDISFE